MFDYTRYFDIYSVGFVIIIFVEHIQTDRQTETQSVNFIQHSLSSELLLRLSIFLFLFFPLSSFINIESRTWRGKRRERRFLFEAKKTLKMSFFHRLLSLFYISFQRQTFPSWTTTTTTTWHSTLAFFFNHYQCPDHPHSSKIFFFFFFSSSFFLSSFSYNVLWIIDYRRL